MALRVMSADSHMDVIYLPPDTFTSRMDRKWADAAPHVVERDGSKWWVSRDATLGPYGVYGPGVTGGKRGRILADAVKLSLPPSAYFKRQIYATFQKDLHGVRAMAEIAPDNVMWGSDYPHRDGTWPFSRKAIEEQFGGIDPKIQQKMLWDNARRVYRIDA